MTDRRAPTRTVLDYARLDWDGATPRSADVGDVYFSGDGLAETRHVFLGGNDLACKFVSADLFVIGELGFGSGLNCLAAWDLWRRSARRPGAHLHLLSVERAPFAPEDLKRAHAAWPELASLAEALRAILPPPVPGAHRVRLGADVTLTLFYGEAIDVLPHTEAQVDAWFLDGFAPSKNADFWTPEIFSDIARLSAQGASLATYTVAGAVRHGLEEAGFAVEKRAGYGRKKEMLAGRLVRPNTRRVRSPWFDSRSESATRVDPPLAPPFQGGEQPGTRDIPPLEKGGALSFPPLEKGGLGGDRRGLRLAVVGGGVAGASLAFAARRAGVATTLFDPQGLAAGASGNPAGLIMPRLDLGETPAARFFLAAYLYTERLLRTLPAPVFRACGVNLTTEDEAGLERLKKILAARLLPDDHLEGRDGGLYLPKAGVVDPAAYVRALAEGTPLLRRRVERVKRTADGIALDTDDGASGPFDAIVFANGGEARRFVEARGLPLSTVAGQVDWFPDAQAPEQALAFGPYAAPAPQGGLVIGATYDHLPQGASAQASREATARNLAAIAAFAPALVNGLDPAASRPRASFRCQTPDRLAVAGPLPDLGFYAGAYDGLRNGLRHAYPRAESIPNVFILSGLGSRGLVTAPLLAEFIVSEITGAPSPLAADIAEAVHPARFFIRDLKRAARKSGD